MIPQLAQPGDTINSSASLRGSRKLMRVAVVVENHPAVVMGGAQYQAHLLACQLSAIPGTEVLFLARRVPSPDDNSGTPYRIQHIGSVDARSRSALIFDALRLWRSLSEFRPDVIYQRMKQSYTGICCLYAHLNNIPLVFHAAHVLDLETRWIRRSAFSRRVVWQAAEGLLGNYGVRRASHIVVQTKEQQYLLKRNFGMHASAVIRNFQPLPETLPEKMCGPIEVLWVANLKKFKRPEIFLDLAERLSHRNDMHFTVVGRAGQTEWSDKIVGRARQLPNVSYLGPLPITHVDELMSRADIFVNTSIDEGFPNTFIQAWSRGAVLVSMTVDTDDGLEANGTGFVASNLNRMTTIVEMLADNMATRAEYAARGFEYARDNHSLENANQLTDIVLSATVK